MRPKILIIENSIDVTGALRAILGSSSYLRNDFDFVFIIPTKSKVKKLIERAGFAVYELPLKEIRKKISSLFLYLPYLIFNVFRLKKIINAERIDLVVNNDCYNLLPPFYRLLGGQIPYISFVRFIPARFPKTLVNFWTKAHLRFSNKLIPVSEAVKMTLPVHSKIIRHHEGIDCTEVIHLNRQSKKILYLANYIQGKGQEYALVSFATICKSFPEWKLRFVGGDMGLQKNIEFKRILASTSKQLGCSEQVEFAAFEENVSKEFGDASIVLNFSNSESFSFTCIEAMQAGLPVIATRSGGPQEFIEHNKNGLLVPVGGIDEMAKELEMLMSNAERRNQMGMEAHRTIERNFNILHTSKDLSKIYKEVLEETTLNRDPHYL